MFKILLVNGLILGGIYGLIALGYSLIYRASGLMSFAQGDMITLGAFMGLFFFDTLKLPFWLSLLLTFAFAFIVGMFLERFVIRLLMNKGVLAIYIVLATIAVSYIIQNSMQMAFGATTLRFPQVFEKGTWKIFGVNAQAEAWACLFISLALMVLLHFYMTKTRFGTSMRAAAMDPIAAESCGINTSLSTGITWGICAAIAGLAGILIGPMYGVFTVLGANMGRKGFGGAVVGGYGNMYGAMVGGMLLGLAETFVAGYWMGTYKNMVAYIILIVFLFLKPTGIFNEKAIQDV